MKINLFFHPLLLRGNNRLVILKHDHKFLVLLPLMGVLCLSP